MKAVILAHGSINDGQELVNECESANYIICADGGAEYALKYNITPDYIIGDLDSISLNVIEYFKSKNVEFIKYPCEKDYTDTELCVYKAQELGCSTICIAAGTGNRIDHSLGNIGLLHLIKKMNINGYILSDSGYIYICNDKIALKGSAGDTISIIPFYGSAKGLFSSGLKYQLYNLNIPFGKPQGVSNVMTGSECSITINSGEILVIKHSKN